MSQSKWVMDRNKPFDSIAKIQIERKGILKRSKLETLIVNEKWFEYLKEHVNDLNEQNKLLKQLAHQQNEQFAMKNKMDHPFFGDEQAFEHYCRVKYKELYQHIIHMIDLLIKKNE